MIERKSRVRSGGDTDGVTAGIDRGGIVEVDARRPTVVLEPVEQAVQVDRQIRGRGCGQDGKGSRALSGPAGGSDSNRPGRGGGGYGGGDLRRRIDGEGGAGAVESDG